jgi:serpin B
MKTRKHVAILAVIAVIGGGLLLGGSRCSKDADKDRGREESVARTESQQGVLHDTEGAQTVRGVDDGSAPATRRLTSIDDRLLGGNARFAFGLFAKTCGSGEPKNIFISPLSVSVALAMTYNGAAGKTAAEMADVLGFRGLDLMELNASMCDLTTTLELADSAVQLTVANSLWTRQGYEFLPDFIERTETFYEAEVASLDFADPGAPAVINGWVNRSTRGLIDKIVDAIHPDARLYLINAIYFKGRWQVEFDPSFTHDRVFYLAGGAENSVPMMSRSGDFRYAEDGGVQVVRLPYGGGRLGMYVFLPQAADGLAGFLKELDDRAFTGWMPKLASREGDVTIPRFKIAYECGLVPALQALGMREAFGASAADFSRMSREELFISEVKHKAVVDVNEEGTEAAAVTSVEMRATSVEAPRDRFTFVADRPFFFVIRDDATGSIVFMGAVYDPSV